MATSPDRPPGLLLNDTEVEEFLALARRYGAELTADEARWVSTQLLRVLAVIRDVAIRSPSVSTSPVDISLLPELPSGVMDSFPPT